MFDVELYTCTSDDRVVDKTITLVGTVQGELREGTGILHPVIRLQLETVPTFNYAKIPAFGNRYYFVDGEPITTSYNMWDVTFRHDPLMNLKEQFRPLEGIIARQENYKNPYLIDELAPIETNSQLHMSSGEKWSGGAKFNTATNVVLISASGIIEVEGTE